MLKTATGWCSVRGEALGSIRSEPDQTIPALAESLRGRDFNVRRMAAAALARSGQPRLQRVEALTRALHARKGNGSTRRPETLAKLGTDAVQAVPTLAEMLKSRAS